MPGQHIGPQGLRRLLEATVAVGSALELRDVLQRVVEAAVDLVDARYGALGVLDETGDRLAQFITVGIDSKTRKAIGDLPKGLGILGSLIRDARPLRLVDLHEHPDSVGFPPNHPPMTSFLGVPIRIRDSVFGNLYLTDKTTGDVFTDVDEELTQGLATAAAVAIENARLFEQVRQREALLAAIQEVSSALLEGVDASATLAVLAARARDLLGADLATVAVPHDEESLLIDVADGPLAGDLRGRTFPISGSVSGHVLRSQEIVVVEDASQDHRDSQPQIAAGRTGPALWLPLVAGDDPFGSLSIARAVGRPAFSTAEIDTARSFATQASVIFEHHRSREYLQRLHVLEDQERIARDLHDTVIQRLFAIGMSLQSTVRAVADPWALERIRGSVDQLDVTIRQIRTVIFGLEELRPTSSAAIRARLLEVVRDSTRALGFEPQLLFEGPLDSAVDGTLAAELAAIVREALTNVARHAAATWAMVRAALESGDLVLEVQDNGQGLDPALAGSNPGRGLRNMRARAERYNGQLVVERRAAGGTRLIWRVPLEPDSPPPYG